MTAVTVTAAPAAWASRRWRSTGVRVRVRVRVRIGIIKPYRPNPDLGEQAVAEHGARALLRAELAPRCREIAREIQGDVGSSRLSLQVPPRLGLV